MRHLKQFLSLGLLLVLLTAFGGCNSKPKDYDVSSYIHSVLDSTYQADNTAYIEFTGVSEQEALLNNTTTLSNAAVRFFTLYGLNASEEQSIALSAVFAKAYKQCTYGVQEKTETKTGFNVTVQFTPMTSFVSIANQIQSMKQGQGYRAYDVGAAYIDDVIALCEDAATNPTFGDQLSKEFDIRLSENGQLSLNINLFDEIDQEMLPFEKSTLS